MTRHVMVQKPKIGLLDHFGTGNLGDDAIIQATLQHIKSRWPHALIIGLSLNPFDSQTRHGIPAYAIRQGGFSPFAFKDKDKLKDVLRKYPFLFSVLRTVTNVAIKKPMSFFREILFLAKSFRVAKSLDLLIICGGGQLLDAWGGPWAFPYTLFKWVLLAKLSHTKCYFVNVGAGPLDYPLSKWFIKRALLLADYISFRDGKSKMLIREIGFRNRTQVVADSVYGLNIPGANITRSHVGRGGGLTIGIAPMAYCDPRRYWHKDKAVYECFIRKLAEFSAGLIRDRHRLRLFSTDIWFDSQAILDLELAIKNQYAVDTATWITSEPVTGINEFLSQLSQVDCVVTCKFHGVVFAHLLNVPVLAISHHPKVATLMDDFELSEYCVDIRKFDVDLLTSTFDRLVANMDDIKACVPRKVACYQRELALQFDQLFPSA
jgi:polysaccharide pyruvyl transferase WcaK-like protein